MTTDGRLVRGDHTRRRILSRAMDIASLEGLEALSIGRLATELKVSKSGVFAHFGSKEELQLAVIRAAKAVFASRVVEPAFAEAPGRRRLEALCDGWLTYSERRVFPGGCFFFSVGAEFDARPGRVRDALADARREWLALYAQTIRDAQQLGELDDSVNPAQLAFELDAFATAANSAALLLDDSTAYARSRCAIRTRLAALKT
ncbi:TetR/AcrR family transcriptional regulator [Actinomadura rudentiformis]|uniref:TetR/AcrR family transcriptional regulator n=1 Tax=Actinomadura rudentiformis TaxID=359158 RepID=A0A6H9YDW6_9ACTN|nr:TetR/AcrR family transcriptional regulator [Actinomadura rudentiformis]KAB2342458.1 TetR/AcrR family transcriptional regulator [Actinomadura rudentiformis]